ncbi:septum site-determining protein MinC [Vibrio mediterranei]|uniref:septum site-determining protein MinC n=1 Tax=Vibrio mediterranei TaxID=689 RepID=UPI0040677C9D
MDAISQRSTIIPTLTITTDKTSDIVEAVRFAIVNGSLAPHSPLVLDCKEVPNVSLDILALKRELKTLDVHIAMVSGSNSEDVAKRAHVAGIGYIGANQQLQIIDEHARFETQVVSSNIRSGQQHYYKNKNVIIVGNVSNGAEVIADGFIYVIGSANGKLIGGALGHKDAFVMAKNFNAEVVSIGGTFLTNEQIPQEVKNLSMIALYEDEKINFKLI